jgi:hypothetical protein
MTVFQWVAVGGFIIYIFWICWFEIRPHTKTKTKEKKKIKF